MFKVNRIFDILDNQMSSIPQDKMFSHKVGSVWKSISTREFQEKTYIVSSALLASGLNELDKIGIISGNRYEWNLVDFGAQQVNVTTVPFYPNISKDEAAFVLEHSEVKMLFISNKVIYDNVCEIAKAKRVPIISFDEIEGETHFTKFLEKGTLDDKQKIEEIKKTISPSSIFTIIYTSGTTGRPKGVMLSHSNLVSNVLGIDKLLPIGPGDRILSFLPINHIFERNVINYYIFKGANIYYAESIDTIGENLSDVKPQMMTCVPRLLEKIYLRILAKGESLTGVKKKIFFWSLDLANKYDIRDEHNSTIYKQKLKIADKLVFSKWREAVGGEMKLIVSGAAPLLPKLAKIFTAAGIPIIEGYGLTETSPVVSFNRFFNLKDRMLGTVGFTIENVEVKIAKDNEILVKGPNVMQGYFKDKEATKAVIDSEGYLHTGDVGELIDNGHQFLKITDRKKEIFKTTGGKYIAPIFLETNLKTCPLIEQVMVVGENKNYVSALITPNKILLEKLAASLGIKYQKVEQLLSNKHILDRYQKEIDAINKHLSRHETIKRFKLLPRDWSIKGGELTPTLKLKRREIRKLYQKEIDELYQDEI